MKKEGVKPEAIKETKVEKTTKLKKFNFTKEGIVIEATSKEEAIKKLKK